MTGSIATGSEPTPTVARPGDPPVAPPPGGPVPAPDPSPWDPGVDALPEPWGPPLAAPGPAASAWGDDPAGPIVAEPLPDGSGASGAGDGPPIYRHDTRLDRWLFRIHPAVTGLALIVVAFAVYWLSNPAHIMGDFYNHFVWQAKAWLDGSAAIPFPSDLGRYGNDYFQDVLPLRDANGLLTGQAQIPFPPLPAVVLLPFVALFGIDTSQPAVAVAIGALNVGLCWRMLLRVTDRRDAAFLGAIFYGFGTVAWYAAQLGSTWYFAHVVASTFLFLGITAALDADRRERIGRVGRSIGGWIFVRQLWAGLLYGMAALARLPTIFAAPFFVFVGAGGSIWRRAVSAGIGAVIPVLILLGYNVATTGHVFHPAYEYLYRHEYRPVAAFWNDHWMIEDPRYIPQNAVIALLWPPQTPLATDPKCLDETNKQGLDILFDKDCPLIRPDKLGMSLLLTSPAYLLAIPALFAYWRRRMVIGASLAILLIALVNLSHFSQGWVQFGYRFSNDFAPLAMILVTLGIARAMRNHAWAWFAVVLIAASVLINAWGVSWGVRLNW